MAHSRYAYHHVVKNGFSDAIDVHEIMISQKKGRSSRLFFIFVFVLYMSHLILMKENPGVYIIGPVLLFIFCAKQWHLNKVKKETVMIIPTFGVQLETHYWSGGAVRYFIPIEKILKPVLNEIVTPVTCYWSLALILRGEDKLTLVFKESRPPVKLLVPIWRALRAATHDESSI